MFSFHLRLMSAPINHHYIPQFYLKGFSQNNATLLTLYNLVDKKFVTRSARTTMSVDHLYSTIDDEGNFDVSIELFLGSLESATKPAFEKLEAGLFFTVGEYIAFLFFVAYLHVRIPGRLQQINELHSKIATFIAASIPEGGVDIPFFHNGVESRFDVTREELDAAKKGDKNAVLASMQSAATGIADLLRGFGTVVYKITNENDAFITTDNAVLLIPPPSWIPGMPLGFSTNGVEIIVPISQKICVIFVKPIYPEEPGLVYGDATYEDVQNINKLMAHHGVEYIIGRDKDTIKKSLSIA